MTQSCLKTARSAPQDRPRRHVQFADPIASTRKLQVKGKPSVTAGPPRLGPGDSYAVHASLRQHPLRSAACPRPASAMPAIMPHVPFQRHPTLHKLAYEQDLAMRGNHGRDKKIGGKEAADIGSLEALADRLELDLSGIVDAVEDSAFIRYGSYAVFASGAVFFVPVAAVMLVGCAGAFASYWSVKQLTALSAATARTVLGLPSDTLKRPPSPPYGLINAAPPRSGTHTHTDFDLSDEF